ncbi:glycosyltransferase family 1 protein [Algoriphagus vanfongensis]|uniref:glycosyltransferase family 1 protein n=1 Tax=Algoriphagus vanfongensis TaxID=426371 RepID=UPI0003F834D8|nr:glycosyltransferase family 1 protein [Algoriphagus vanfongensis]
MVRLIFDTISSGHHPEYVLHLFNYIKLNGNISYRTIFIVPYSMKEILNNSVGDYLKDEVVDWYFLEDEVCFNLHKMNLFKRSFKYLSLVKYYVELFNATDVLLMWFNYFEVSLVFNKPSFNIRGILFSPYYRIEKNSLKKCLKFYFQSIITYLYIKNRSLDKVFILNDFSTVNSLNSKFNKNIFNVLPDPIPIYKMDPEFDLYKHYNIPRYKKVLLHAGSIDVRKGTLEIIDAIDYLETNISSEYAILIVGKAKSNVEKLIYNRLSKIKNKGFSIIFDNSFVSNERLKSLFVQSFCVLMPYKNPEASSGILGHSVLSKIPVIGPNKGLLGELINSYHLGLTLESINGKEIADCIFRLNNEKFEFDSTFFIEYCTTENFSNSLLK